VSKYEDNREQADAEMEAAQAEVARRDVANDEAVASLERLERKLDAATDPEEVARLEAAVNEADGLATERAQDLQVASDDLNRIVKFWGLA
jgi:hypothetical protein